MVKKISTMGRKFVYNVGKPSKEIIEYFKKLACKYNVIRFTKNEDEMLGFIYFDNAKSLSSVKKLMIDFKVEVTDETIDKLIDTYKRGNYWETGVIPKQGRKPITVMEQEKIEMIDDNIGITNTKENIEQDVTSKPITNELEGMTNNFFNETIMNLLKQNIDLHNQNKDVGSQNVNLLNVFIESNNLMREELKEIKQAQSVILSQKNNNININNNIEKIENKTFNINVFLNEECKNAISLTDFINTIQIQESDLFYAKNNGLVEAITNVFQRELLKYDLIKRPVHCTDLKRETIHIKEQEGWVKENANDGLRLKRAISTISNKKIQKLNEYVSNFPEMNNVSSPKYEDGLKLMIGIMGGTEHPDVTNRKVQKNIAKAVYLSKSRDT